MGRRPRSGDAAPVPRRGFPARHGAWLAVLAALALVAVVRGRLLDLPLERDEGEYAYAGQLIRQGVPPYVQAYNMKFPGTYYAYALAMTVFGETPRGIRLGLLVVNAGSVLLLFALGRRLLGALGGAVAAVAFALLTLDLWSMSLFAHATHFVLLPALAGLLLLAGGRGAARLLAAGALLGLAVLMKQHAFAFPLLGALLVLAEARERGRAGTVRDLALLAAGGVAPFLVLLGVLAAHGALGRFWFWAFDYALAYATGVPADRFLVHLVDSFRDAARGTVWLWAAGGAGLVALGAGRWPARTRWWLAGLAAASAVAAGLGGIFRPHYFILLMPAAALLAGAAVTAAARPLERALPAGAARAATAALFAALCAWVLADPSGILRAPGPRAMMLARYGTCPFAEAREVGRVLGERSRPGDRIAVLGSEPEIYFHARRRSATGYIYMYPLTEGLRYAARMQAEMIAEIEAARPAYVVFVQEVTTWNLSPASDMTVLHWGARYVAAHYRRIGVVDMFSDGSRAVWGDEAESYQPRSPHVIHVYERRPDAPAAGG